MHEKSMERMKTQHELAMMDLQKRHRQETDDLMHEIECLQFVNENTSDKSDSESEESDSQTPENSWHYDRSPKTEPKRQQTERCRK